MRRRFAASSIILGSLLLTGTAVLAQADNDATKGGSAPQAATAPTAGKKELADTNSSGAEPSIRMTVPLFGTAFNAMPLAEVNGEPITLEELRGALASSHEGRADQRTKARIKYGDVLDRLINIKLLSQEARNIGLDQTESLKALFKAFDESAMRELLLKERLAGLKLDDKEVEARYHQLVKEYKLLTVRFAKEADARRMAQELKAGHSYEELAQKALKDKTAEGNLEPVYQQALKQLPQVALALEKVKAGGTTDVLRLEQGFAVVKLLEVGYPENEQARTQARRDVLEKARNAELVRMRQELFKKHAKLDQKLLNKLDFEAPKPGYAALAKDKRVLVTVTGETPITVADLAQAIREKFFHGVDLAIKEKKVNAVKEDLLNQMLYRRIFLKEARLQGIDKSAEFLRTTSEYRESITFGTFIEKVVKRDVKLTEDEAKKYYDAHLKDYEVPGNVTLSGLAFTGEQAAQSALEKLRQGVDLKWLASTAELQVKADDPELITFRDEPVDFTALPEGLRKVVEGAVAGDLRLYKMDSAHFYVIKVLGATPLTTAPYLTVRMKIMRALYDEKMKQTLDDWVKKLRAGSEVRVYADFGVGR